MATGGSETLANTDPIMAAAMAALQLDNTSGKSNDEKLRDIATNKSAKADAGDSNKKADSKENREE